MYRRAFWGAARRYVHGRPGGGRRRSVGVARGDLSQWGIIVVRRRLRYALMPGLVTGAAGARGARGGGGGGGGGRGGRRGCVVWAGRNRTCSGRSASRRRARRAT